MNFFMLIVLTQTNWAHFNESWKNKRSGIPEIVSTETGIRQMEAIDNGVDNKRTEIFFIDASAGFLHCTSHSYYIHLFYNVKKLGTFI